MSTPANADSELLEKIKRLIFIPVHIDHQNIEPDEVTITKEGLDWYASKLAEMITESNQALLDRLESEGPKERDITFATSNQPSWHSIGFNRAIGDQKAVIKRIREEIK